MTSGCCSATPRRHARSASSTVRRCSRARPKDCSRSWQSLLSPVDAAALTPEFAAFLVNSGKVGLATSDQGWWDDGCAHLAPWGFEVADIRIPVQLWHGAQDQFVPFQHGQWLAAHIPGVEAHLSENDGHVTLGTTRIPDVHEWLLRHTLACFSTEGPEYEIPCRPCSGGE